MTVSAISLPTIDQTLWALAAVSLVHIVEEYSLGFLNWFRAALPKLAPAITAGWALVINILFVGWLVAVAAASTLPPAVRLSGAAIVLVNALLHVAFTIRTRRYSPGLVTGVVLYVPCGVATYAAADREHILNAMTLAGSICLGVALHATTVISLRIRVAISQRNRER